MFTILYNLTGYYNLPKVVVLVLTIKCTNNYWVNLKFQI